MKARRRKEAASNLPSPPGAVSRGRLLIIEDEPDLQELLRYNLVREGFEVSCTDRGEVGLEMVRRALPDLVVLDLMLPGMDGLEVCRALRADPATAAIPVVMVTARDQEADIVLGLELGADDYVTKPYRWRELLARIRAVLRRRAAAATDQPAEDQPLRVRNLIIDPQRHAVTVDGKPVDLTVTEFKLLRVLASRPGRVFTRKQIIDAMHGDLAAVTDRSVDVQVVSLRRKLSTADPQAGDDIETIRGVGYRFRE